MRLRYIFAALWFAATAGMLFALTVWWLIEGREKNESFTHLLGRYAIALCWPLLMLVPKGRAMIYKEVLQIWL